MVGAQPVSSDDLRTIVDAWRNDPEQGHPCPSCHAPGVEIVDRSARPYAEWYVITCASCGLDQTLNIPLGGPPPFADG